MIPTSLKELAFYAILCASGLALFFVGNLLFHRREGGRRAVMLGASCGMGFLGGWVIRHFWLHFRANHYPEALPFYIGGALLTVAVCIGGVAIFGSEQKVRTWFEAIIRGL
jgi:hypothetical protein